MTTLDKNPQPANMINNIDSMIIELRKQKVILDSDVAAIYGVETRDINKSVKNNPAKFPQGYILELDKKELEDLRWNLSTAKLSKTRTSPKLNLAMIKIKHTIKKSKKK